MNNRTLIILSLLISVTLGSIWFISRKPHTPKTPLIDTLIVGTNTDFPPFSTMIEDEIAGFDIDIAREIAKRLHKPILFKNMSFEVLIPELQLGTIHMIAAGMTPTPERSHRVLFAPPHLEGDPLMAVQRRGAQPITTQDELSGKTIVVNQGYSSDMFVSDLDNVEVVRMSSPLISTGLMTLNGNQADVYVVQRSSLQPYLEKASAQYTISPIKNTAEAAAFAISKQYPTLFTQVQEQLAALQKDGTIAALKKKWNLDDH